LYDSRLRLARVPRRQERAMSELELKFEVTPDDLKRLARHPAFAGKADRASLSTTYFDTPANDLRAAGLSLRVRRKAGQYVQTMKRTRAGVIFDRDEWESPTAHKTPDTALLAQTPAAGVLEEHAEQLAPRFTTRIRRDARLYRLAGALVELSIDKGDIVGEGRSEPMLELELELKDGEPGALYALAEDLAELAPIRLAFDSKSERGYRLIADQIGGARKAEGMAVSPNMTTAVAFACIAHACLVQLAGNAQALRRARRADSLHQARIGLRRLRSAMTVFKSVVADEAFEGLRAECKWATGELNLARNLDVFLAKVSAAAAQDPTLNAYVERLGQARTAAYDRALAALSSARFSRFLLRSALWIENGSWLSDPDCGPRRERPIGAFAAEALDHLRKAVRKQGKDLSGLDPVVRHHLRIKAKKLRYAAEFFEHAFDIPDKRRRRFIGKLKALQDALGELNDIAVAPQTALHGVFGRKASDLAFTAGKWVGAMKAREPELIETAMDAFGDFKAAKPFWPS
jgi:triphosphatase